MADVHNLEDIKKELTKRREDAQARRDAWANVKRSSKKDGTDYAVISKNFTGLSSAPTANETHPQISIWTRTPSGRGVGEELNVYLYQDEMTDEDKQSRQGTFYTFGSFYRGTYFMTISEIFERIANRITWLDNYVSCLDAQLASIDDVYNEYYNAVKEAQERLKASTVSNDKYNSDSYYLVREAVNRMYL